VFGPPTLRRGLVRARRPRYLVWWGWLFGGEESGVGSGGADFDVNLSEAFGASALVGGGGLVAVDALVEMAALEEDADIWSVVGVLGGDLGVGDVVGGAGGLSL